MGNPTTTPLAENFHNGGFLVSEANGHLSRDPITLAAAVNPPANTAVNALAGLVLGQITTGASASYSALGTNTGNATIGTIATNTIATQIGQYKLVYTDATHFTVTAPDGDSATGVNGTAFSALGIGFTMTTGGTAMVAGDGFTITTVAAVGNPTATSAANAGNTGNSTSSAVTTTGYAPQLGNYVVEFDAPTLFIVTDPGGSEVGHGVTGTAFSGGGLGFTITAGGTAMAAGDSFVIAVAAGSNKWKQWDPSAVDGSQTAAAILFGTKDITSADRSAVAITRDAEVNATELVWPTNCSAAQIASATAQLKSLGIIAR